jgi:hypothetical protein
MRDDAETQKQEIYKTDKEGRVPPVACVKCQEMHAGEAMYRSSERSTTDSDGRRLQQTVSLYGQLLLR